MCEFCPEKTQEQIDVQKLRNEKFNSFLAGKTIESVDATGINLIFITLTDGSKFELEAETAIHTNFGDIPGVFIRIPGEKESY